jgi:hypothetical protein
MKIAYTIDEAEAASGISKSKLYEHLKTGALVGKKAGGTTLIRVEDLKAFVDNLPAWAPMSERAA